MKSKLPLVVAFVLVFAFGLMLVAFRSLVVAAKAIVLNLLSVAAAYGVLVIVFQYGFAKGLLGFSSTAGIDPVVPLLLFVILFGLSMDYHVLVIGRIREAFNGGASMDDAISHGIKRTAGVVTSAAVVMVGVFSIFGLLSMLMFKQFGVGLATAILIDATIVRARASAGDDEAARRVELVPPAAGSSGFLGSRARARARAGDRAGSDLRLSPKGPASYSGRRRDHAGRRLGEPHAARVEVEAAPVAALRRDAVLRGRSDSKRVLDELPAHHPPRRVRRDAEALAERDAGLQRVALGDPLVGHTAEMPRLVSENGDSPGGLVEPHLPLEGQPVEVEAALWRQVARARPRRRQRRRRAARRPRSSPASSHRIVTGFPATREASCGVAGRRLGACALVEPVPAGAALDEPEGQCERGDQAEADEELGEAAAACARDSGSATAVGAAIILLGELPRLVDDRPQLLVGLARVGDPQLFVAFSNEQRAPRPRRRSRSAPDRRPAAHGRSEGPGPAGGRRRRSSARGPAR